MRFELLAVSIFVVGTGAAGVKLGIVPIPDQMAQAVRALGGDPSQLKTVEINPIRAIYDNVMRAGQRPPRRINRPRSLARLWVFPRDQRVPHLPDFRRAMQNAMSKPASRRAKRLLERTSPRRTISSLTTGWRDLRNYGLQLRPVGTVRDAAAVLRRFQSAPDTMPSSVHTSPTSL